MHNSVWMGSFTLAYQLWEIFESRNIAVLSQLVWVILLVNTYTKSPVQNCSTMTVWAVIIFPQWSRGINRLWLQHRAKCHGLHLEGVGFCSFGPMVYARVLVWSMPFCSMQCHWFGSSQSAVATQISQEKWHIWACGSISVLPGCPFKSQTIWTSSQAPCFQLEAEENLVNWQQLVYLQ